MTIQLTTQEINWIASEFKNNRSIFEISVDTGMSVSNVKRALAEAGLLNLNWYKTANEITMLNYLKGMGIYNLEQLRNTL